MDRDSLHDRVRLHNALHLFLGIAFIPLSILAWIASFFLARLMAAMVLSIFDVNAWKIAGYIAAAFMIVLVIEGIRYSRPLFELKTYTESSLYDNAVMQSPSGSALDWHYGGISGMAFLVSQFFFFAPRSIVHCYKSFRGRLNVNPQTIDTATQILAQLRTARQWVPATHYAAATAAVNLLVKLHLIWTDTTDGILQVRYPAGQR